MLDRLMNQWDILECHGDALLVDNIKAYREALTFLAMRLAMQRSEGSEAVIRYMNEAEKVGIEYANSASATYEPVTD